MREGRSPGGRLVLASRVLLFAVCWAAALLPVVVAMAPLASSRTFLHLEEGRRIAANGLHASPQAGEAEPGGAPSTTWLADLLLDRVHEAGGPLGLRLLAAAMASIVMGGLALWLSRTSRSPFLTALGLILPAYLLLPYLHPSPELLALPVLLAGSFLLSRADRPSSLWGAAATYLIAAAAANLDAEMAAAFLLLYGLLLLLHAPVALLRGARDGTAGRWAGTHLWCFALGLAGLLSNPWPLRLPAVLWRRVSLDPVFPRAGAGLGPAITVAALAGMAGVLVLVGLDLAAVLLGHRSERGASVAQAVCALAAAAGAALSVPRFWLLFPALLLVLHERSPLALALGQRGGGVRRAPHGVGWPALLVLLLALLPASLDARVRLTARRLAVPEEFMEEVDPDALPVDAARFLREAGIQSRLFHEPAWGGYLDFELPGADSFPDPHLATLPAHLREAVSEILAGGPEASRLLRDYDIHLLVVRDDRSPPGRSGEWARVFRNRLATIYLERVPATLDLLVRASRYYRSRSIPQGAAENFEESVVLEANPSWSEEFHILTQGAQRTAARLYTRIAGTQDRDERVALLRRLGNLYARLGLHDSALREWTRALQIRERDRNLLYNIGVAQLRLDRLEDARRTFQTYHVLYPEDREVERTLEALDQALSL